MFAFITPLLLPNTRPSPFSVSPRRPSFPHPQPQTIRHRCSPRLSISPPPSSSTSSTTLPPPASSSLRAALLYSAIGKLGARPLPDSLVPSIHSELNLLSTLDFSPSTFSHFLLRASFLASLYIKSDPTSSEASILSFAVNTPTRPSPLQILSFINQAALPVDHPLFIFALRLLNRETLSVEEAFDLGCHLYAQTNSIYSPEWPVRVLIAHIMRVRHETEDEIRGLCVAAKETKSKHWGTVVSTQHTILQVAEPFDGVITWDLITPLLCKVWRETYAVQPVMVVGRSAGPKYGPNLRDVVNMLGVPRCTSAHDVFSIESQWGVAIDQVDVSPGLDQWVDIRKVIVKRPSLATTEKYVGTGVEGGVFVGSAFHGGYVEKMAAGAEEVGYDAYVIVGKGVEGTLGARVGGKLRLLVGWKTSDGYGREMVEWEQGVSGDKEEKGGATVERMVKRIREWGTEQGEKSFGERVDMSIAAFDRAFSVLEREKPGLMRKRE